jgi:outer membrane protein TolC
VRAAASSVGDLSERARLAQSSLDLAVAQEQLARTNLEQGVGSQLDVLSAVVRTAGARVALVQARASLQLAVYSLQNALGAVEVPVVAQSGAH